MGLAIPSQIHRRLQTTSRADARTLEETEAEMEPNQEEVDAMTGEEVRIRRVVDVRLKKEGAPSGGV